MSKIDLGKKWDHPVDTIESVMKETHYPTLHIDDIDDKRLAEMPDTGTLVIRYKIRSRTHNERKDGQGDKKKHTCSVTLDITHIDPPAKPVKKKNGDSDNGLRKNFSDYWKEQDKK